MIAQPRPSQPTAFKRHEFRGPDLIERQDRRRNRPTCQVTTTCRLKTISGVLPDWLEPDRCIGRVEIADNNGGTIVKPADDICKSFERFFTRQVQVARNIDHDDRKCLLIEGDVRNQTSASRAEFGDSVRIDLALGRQHDGVAFNHAVVGQCD